MDYTKFCHLVRAGEQAHIDRKIECHAFSGNSVAPNGELAKDICAMANQGYQACYLLVGVSNDGKQFKSVANPKLADDALQDFSKKAIYPPPKVKLTWETWPKAAPEHAGKQFVVIQIGPQKRQAFHLAQDFIDYPNKVCYRRNEVWIRRGATSDLATPEEICRLASGQPALVDEEDEARRQERADFALKALGQRTAALAAAAPPLLLGLGYTALHGPDWFELDDKQRDTLSGLFMGWSTLRMGEGWRYSRMRLTTRPLRAFVKQVGHVALFALLWSPTQALTMKQLQILGEGLSGDHADRQRQATLLADIAGERIAAVRRLSLVPVVSSVPPGRIAKAIPNMARAHSNLHFYRVGLIAERWGTSKGQAVASSTELVVIDAIQSVGDLAELLPRVVSEAERETAPIIRPTRGSRRVAGPNPALS